MNNPEDVVRLLSSQEESIGELYAEFSKLFPEYRDFWDACSKDEFKHAEIIRSLNALAGKGEIILTGRFHQAALQTSMQFIRNQIQRAKEKKIAFLESFSIAFSLESSLLENRFFDAFSGDTAGFQKIKQYLTEETKKHKNKIQEAWEKNR